MAQEDPLGPNDPWVRALIRNKLRRQVRLGGLPQQDCADWQQELLLHVVRRLPTFDPQRETSQRGFVLRIVSRKLANLKRDRQAAKRQSAKTCSLEGSNAGPGGGSLAGRILRRCHDRRLGRHPRGQEELAQLQTDVEAVLRGLPPELRALAQALKHHKLSQIARRWKVTRHSLSKLRERLRAKFHDAGLQDH